MKTFYETLASWWPLISPVEEYESEVREVVRLIESHAPDARALLELGSGGGHNAFYLRKRFHVTLTDLSSAMLEQSKMINPDCEHLIGDMRTLDLQREFDVVFGHDSLDYMTSEHDLAQTFATAYRHLRKGGLFICLPDDVRERFEPGTECGGSDGDDGRSIRYLEWSPEISADATTCVTLYSFLAREADGTTRHFVEEHLHGIFTEATWVALLERAGFAVTVVDEAGVEDERAPRRIFVARKPGE